MPVIGQDFRNARRNTLISAVSDQGMVSTLLFFTLFLILQFVLPQIPAIYAVVTEGQAAVDKLTSPNFFLQMLGVMIPTGLLVSWLVYQTAKRRGGVGLMPELLRLPNLGWGGWLMVVAGFVIIMGTVAFAVRTLSGDMTSMGEVEKLTAGLRGNPLAYFIVPIAIGLAAPMAEEFLFRGPLLVRLKQTALGSIGTLVVTSFVWAMIHVTQPWINIALIFVMGLVLGSLLLRFGSIWVPVACHCVWNLLTTAALFFAELPAQLPT
jgi:uncharacterized protein